MPQVHWPRRKCPESMKTWLRRISNRSSRQENQATSQRNSTAAQQVNSTIYSSTQAGRVQGSGFRLRDCFESLRVGGRIFQKCAGRGKDSSSCANFLIPEPRTLAPARSPILPVVLLILAAAILPGCAGRDTNEVVVYTAHDRGFSEPILKEFEKQTGIRVLVKYDTEATKTVGLVNAIRSEKNRPRCDVFWNNEIVHTVRLKNEELLQPCEPENAKSYPAQFKDPDNCWYGFAGRARVLLVNTNAIAGARGPDSMQDLANPAWKGRAGIAKPLFGTTATHAACLFALMGEERAREFFQSMKNNDVQIMSGNKAVAQHVGSSLLAFGVTDTDDALEEIAAGKPVKIVFPDAAANQAGVLFIPNTLALVKGAPHAGAGKKLINYLLSQQVEVALARSPAAQFPLNPEVKTELQVKLPAEMKAMPVDLNKAAETYDRAAKYIEEFFLK
ncbi:MAG: iron transporter [Verrucomicrobia bacterium]|nr:iron transporter [Verrucomicrobiota bacterium]